MPRLSTGIGSVDDFLQQYIVLGAMQRPYFNSRLGKTCNVYRLLVLEGPREEAFRLLPGFLQSTEPRPTLVQSLCEILPSRGALRLFMDLGFYDVDAKRGQQEAHEKLKKVLKKLCQDLKKVLPESMVGSCEDIFQEEGWDSGLLRASPCSRGVEGLLPRDAAGGVLRLDPDIPGSHAVVRREGAGHGIGGGETGASRGPASQQEELRGYHSLPQPSQPPPGDRDQVGGSRQRQADKA